MRARVESLSSRTLTIAAIGAVVLYAAVVWLLMVSPKRGEAAEAGAAVAAAEIALAEARATSSRPGSTGGAPVADVFRLAKAMPASADQSSLVLELSKLAERSGVTLRVIAPQEPLSSVGGPTRIPISVTVGGSYFKITRFVRSTQALVKMRRGKIKAKGRLFAVQSIELGESATEKFPLLDAIVVLHAFVYDGPIVPVEIPEATGEELEPSSSAAGSTS